MYSGGLRAVIDGGTSTVTIMANANLDALVCNGVNVDIPNGQLMVSGASAIPFFIGGTNPSQRARIDPKGTAGDNIASWQIYNEGTFKGQFGYAEGTDLTTISGPNGSLVSIILDVLNNVAVPNGTLIVGDLAGAGSRPVVVDANGRMSAP